MNSIMSQIKDILKSITLVRKSYDKLKNIQYKIIGYKTEQYYKKNNAKLFLQTYDSLSDLLKNKCDVYSQILNYCFENNLDRLNMKLKRKVPISVGFLVYSSTIWQYESLYRLMENSDVFKPNIILCSIAEKNKKLSCDQYQMSKSWFLDNKYNVIAVNEKNTAYTRFGWEKYNFDIIFAAIPYGVYPKKFCIWNAQLRSLLCYIPYGVAINEMGDRYFDLKIHNLAWKLFYETEIHRKMAKEFSSIQAQNVVVSGYVKMDNLLKKTSINHYDHLWKQPDEKNRKHIVYAPHHSLTRDKSIFSTFDQNYMFFLNYASSHVETTSWIFKPHPLLKKAAIESGLFKNEKEYNLYINAWDKLPNARVVLQGEYTDIFLSSDTMILDSESFLFEYQYTHKPLLFLCRKSQTFNSFGKELLKISYSTDGSNYKEIQEYIENVVLLGKDTMYETRINFYNTYLDYYHNNGYQYAGEFVYKYILNCISNR